MKKKSLFVSGSKVKDQKNIFFVYLLSHWISKKLGLDRDQSSKKHRFLPGSKVKKTFSFFICFRDGSRKNLVSIETKVQKKIDFSQVQRSKKHLLCLFASDTGYLVQYLVLFVLFTGKSKYFSTFLQYK